MSKLLRGYFDKEGEGGGGGGGGEGPSPEVIARATEMGWVPKDKWTKDPEKWSDADAYIERAESVLPIVLTHNRELKGEVKELKRAQAQLIEDGKQFRKMIEANVRAEFEGQIAELEAVKAQAITDGDGAGVVKAERAIKTAEAEAEKKIKEGTQQQQSSLHPDFAPWVKDNAWYEDDKDLRMIADGVAIRYLRDEGLIGKALYDKVASEVKRLRPDKFESPNPDGERGQVVEGAAARPAVTKRVGGKRSFSDLPDDAKAACKRYVANGWAKTEQEYIDEYFKQPGV